MGLKPSTLIAWSLTCLQASTSDVLSREWMDRVSASRCSLVSILFRRSTTIDTAEHFSSLSAAGSLHSTGLAIWRPLFSACTDLVIAGIHAPYCSDR